MSKRSNKKKRAAVCYEPNPPRCANCTHLQRAFTFSIDGQKHYQPARCVVLDIPTKAHAVCDVWQGTDGSTLE